MRRIISILTLFLAFAAVADAALAPQDSTVRCQTILRTDTITVSDTIVRTRRILRTDVISRSEVVLGNDFIVRIGSGKGYSKGNVSVGVPVVVPDSSRTVCPEEVVPAGPVTDVPVAVSDTVRTSGIHLPERDGGRYLWVPDSLAGDVSRFINGGPDMSVVNKGVDFSERVTFRGDTVQMMLRDRNLGRFDRGLFNYLFIPKGIWQIGVTASYGEFSTADLEVLDLLSDIDLSGHAFSIRPYFSYFIRNNMSVGLRLGYSSGRANIDSFNVDIDEDMSFNLKDIYYRSESYTAALTFNQYYGISRRGRFGIYNEVELAFSSGNSDFNRPFNGEPKLTHTTTMQAALNFSPGVCVFIMDQVSFNISFGVFGFSLRNEKQTVDGVNMGNRFTSGANFRFNIFNINFGIAVNL